MIVCHSFFIVQYIVCMGWEIWMATGIISYTLWNVCCWSKCSIFEAEQHQFFVSDPEELILDPNDSGRLHTLIKSQKTIVILPRVGNETRFGTIIVRGIVR